MYRITDTIYRIIFPIITTPDEFGGGIVRDNRVCRFIDRLFIG